MADLNKILPIILVALILVSAVQAFQLNSLKEKFESGKAVSPSSGSKSPVSTGTGLGKAAASSSPGGSGASISDLPTMVGGC